MLFVLLLIYCHELKPLLRAAMPLTVVSPCNHIWRRGVALVRIWVATRPLDCRPPAVQQLRMRWIADLVLMISPAVGNVSGQLNARPQKDCHSMKMNCNKATLRKQQVANIINWCWKAGKVIRATVCISKERHWYRVLSSRLQGLLQQPLIGRND